jgi:hypothetical protein
MSQAEIVRRAFEAFAAETAVPPTISLRGGDAIDDYREPPPFDADIDAITDEYLFKYTWGVGYLNPVSWRHYLPHIIEHSVRLYQQGSGVIDAVLNSLRPPDREPSRLASVSPDQESVMVEFLDLLAFSAESKHQDLACQVLEEWWSLGALYRGLPT